VALDLGCESARGGSTWRCPTSCHSATATMMQSNSELSPQFKARAAGGLWLLCIISGMAGFVVGAPLIVANDATATAANILAKESLFRLGFAADLISGLAYVGVTAFIYYLLRPVSRSLSLVGAFFGLAGVAIGGGSWIIHLTPLLLLRWLLSNFRHRSFRSAWYFLEFSASRSDTLLRDRPSYPAYSVCC